MASNMIRKAAVDIKGGPGGAGIWVRIGRLGGSAVGLVQGFGRLFIDRKGGVPEPISSDRVNVLPSNVTAVALKSEDDGVTVVSMSTGGSVNVTLPSATAAGPGTRFRVLVGALPGSGNGTTITPASTDRFQGNGHNAKTAGQTLINTAATDAIGDYVDLVSDGGTRWFVINKVGTWA